MTTRDAKRLRMRDAVSPLKGRKRAKPCRWCGKLRRDHRGEWKRCHTMNMVRYRGFRLTYYQEGEEGMRKPKQVKRAVRRVTRSPLNEKRWVLDLACGHEVWVTSSKRPVRTEAHCEVCARAESGNG